jgi:hypothetical protein
MRKPKTLEEWQRYFAEAKTAGKTRKQMADELGIATSAIGYHMGKLRKTESSTLVKLPRSQSTPNTKTIVVFPSGIRTEFLGVSPKEILEWVAAIK